MKLNSLRPVPGKNQFTIVTDGLRHLICLPYSIVNLHRMAASLGIGRHWFHKDHYDVPKERRIEIEQNALKVSPRVIVRLIRLRAATEEQRFYEEFIQQGKTRVHFCPTWHHIAIHEESPEYDACLCDLDVPT